MSAPGAATAHRLLHAATKQAAPVIVLAAVGTLIPLAVARHFNALGVARGDDWSYLVTLFRWVDSGHLSFNNWVSMTLIGQLVLSAPIAARWGHAIALVQTETAIIGFVGLLCVVRLGRRLGLSSLVALTVALCVAVTPIWAILSTTYMTDVWAFSLSMLAMLIAIIALQRDPVPLPLVSLGLLVSAYAVTVRQYAVVCLVAIAIPGARALLGRRSRRVTLGSIAVIVLVGSALVVFLHWWNTVPDAKTLTPSFPDRDSVANTVIKAAGFIRLAGLSTLPIILFAGPGRIIKRALDTALNTSVLVLVGSSAVLAGTVRQFTSSLFVGNYVSRDGALSIAVLGGRRPAVLPDQLWSVLVVAGSMAGMVLLVALVPTMRGAVEVILRRRKSAIEPAEAILIIALGGYLLAYTAATLTGIPLYDRYALPVLPLIGILLARNASRPPRRANAAVAFFALLASGVIGLTYAVDSAAFDGARWHLAMDVSQSAGLRARDVNGGFEWVNFHRGRRSTTSARPLTRVRLPDGRTVITSRFCINLLVLGNGESISPVLRPAVVGQRSYPGILRRPGRIVAFRSTLPCPTARKPQTKSSTAAPR